MCMTVCDGSCAARVSQSAQSGESLPVRLGFLLADLTVLIFRLVVKPLVRFVVVPVAVAVFVLAVRAGVALAAAARRAIKRRAMERPARQRFAQVATPVTAESRVPQITAEPCVSPVTLADLAGRTPAHTTRKVGA